MDLHILVATPLLTLMLIIASGFLIGRIRLGGFSLGVSAVLFTGMLFSAINPKLILPEIIYAFGLALFVYTIGLASGPGFFAALRKKGLSLNITVVLLLVLGAAGAYVLAAIFKIDDIVASGMYTGAFTNTPALAGIIDSLHRSMSALNFAASAAQPVVGYSLAYPLGVLGAILAISVFQRVWRIDHAAEGRASAAGSNIASRVVKVLRTDEPQVVDAAHNYGFDIKISRIRDAKGVRIARPDDHLHQGEFVAIVGAVDDLDKATAWIGEASHQDLTRDNLDYRRILVSNPDMVGHSLEQLNTLEKHGIIITRIRRGDVDMLAHRNSELELGDRIRIVAPKDQMAAATKLFGDSYHAVSEMDVLTFSVGLSLGILVGLIPIPMFGGGVFTLGSAGGPLIVALILGSLGRTGPILWQIPYSANLTLRQVGVVLFLAGIGTRAGSAFAKAVSDPASLYIILAGGILTFSIASLALVLGYKVMKLPFGQVAGMLSGMQTQPAALAYANEQAKNDLPNIGYTTVYPVAMISKIVLAQVLLLLLMK